MRIGIRSLMLVGATLVALTVAAGFGTLSLMIRDLGNDSRAASSASKTLTASSGLQRLTVDLETAVRGFVITRDRAYLAPYRSALPRLPQLEQRLVDLARNDDHQSARARALADGIERFRRRWVEPEIVDATSNRAAVVERLGAGKAQLDALRRQFELFDRLERAYLARRSHEVEHKNSYATTVAAGGLVVSLLLLGAGGVILARLVVSPIKRLAVATTRLAAGDYAARVARGGVGEASDLAVSFNAMADALEEQRVELDAQQDELERSLTELERENARTAALYSFGTRLAAESELGARCRVVLDGIADAAGAEVGALAIRSVDDPSRVVVAAVRGLDRAQLDEEVTAGVGGAGRALAERRLVAAPAEDAPATMRASGRDVTEHHELHLPLVERDQALGVLTLRRLRDAPLGADELELVDHLVHQATLALANALSLARFRRLAGINAAVLDATLDGIAMVDPDGRLAFMNAAMEESLALLGIDRTQPLHGWVATLARRAADGPAIADVLRRIEENAALSHEFVDVETGRAFQLRTAPVTDGEGEAIGRLLHMSDTTAEREAARLKDEFVATVSHELRTPLTSINGYVEILLDEDEDSLTDDQRRFLGVISRSSDRLMQLVGDLLLVSQIDAGKFAIASERVDLGLVVAESAESARAVADEKQVAVRTEVDAVPPVVGDRARLAQVVDNLLSNAIKFTPGGGDVAVKLSADDGRCVLEVSDSGIGIPPAERGQLFQRFFRTSRASEHAIAGTGLGLAITKAIVDAHGGTIGVVDREGPGTTFRLELPAGGFDGMVEE